jgi:hypothetical protein
MNGGDIFSLQKILGHRILDMVRNYASIPFIKEKENVTVCYEATKGNPIASVFGIRMIRRDTDN